MAQVVECLLSKNKALSSSSSITKKEKKNTAWEKGKLWRVLELIY
jgi:hypothetical protein